MSVRAASPNPCQPPLPKRLHHCQYGRYGRNKMRIKNIILFPLIILGILLLLIVDLIDGKKETENLAFKQAKSYGIDNPLIIDFRHKNGQVNSLMQYAMDIYFSNSKNYGIVLESNKKIYYCDYDYKTRWWIIRDENDKILNIE